ncbi:MAG: site-specific integrase [Pseudonocardia sp.]|nr:site-specific integrase [Pseudonocardia sp.]
MIHFRAWKGWGELGALDRVPCPGELANLAVEAIAKTQSLTAPLRAKADPEVAGRLFLIPDNAGAGGRALALRDHSLHEYVFSGQDGRDPGVLARYAEELAGHDLAGFTLHHSRHTNATHLVEGGAAATTVSTYLGHNGGWNGQHATSTEQATVFYVAGATEPMRAVRADQLSRGEGTGYLLDALLRLGAEGVPEGERVGWRGALELPLEEAMRRIQEADILTPMPTTVAEAKRLLAERGVPMMATVWGGCLLPAEDGDCPAGPNGCSVGTHANDPAVKQGCGCRWRALLPVAVDHLEDDLALIRGQLEVAEARPERASARSKLQTELAIKEMELATARRLHLVAEEAA